MNKQKFIEKWNSVKQYIDSTDIKGYTQNIKVDIGKRGFIIATDYEFDNNNYIRFLHDANGEYNVPIGKFSLNDIHDMERYISLKKIKVWY